MADLKGGADSREEVLSDYRVLLPDGAGVDTLPSGGNSGVRRDGICILPFISGVRSDASGGDAAAVFKRRELCRRRKEELRLQFKEAIQIVASALAAGYSVENAFIASVRDLEEQYGKRRDDYP